VNDALTRLLEPVRGVRSILFVGVLAVGSASLLTIGHPNGRRAPASAARPTPSEPVHCIEMAQPDVPLAAAIFHPITLEHRWLVGSFASPAEVDAALGTTIEPWQTFTYVFDSQPRLAIASEIYPVNAPTEHEFRSDEYNGIWLVQKRAGKALRAGARVTYTRDIYLLPAGSNFRGVR
jgi:hypothetical protein